MEQQPYFRSEDFALQLEVSGKLLELITSITEGTVRPCGGIRPRNTVFLLLTSKSMVTYRAIRTLLQQAFVDEAMVLARTMIEAAVNAAYILHVGGDAEAQRYVDFPRYKRYLDAKKLKEISPELTPLTPEQWDEIGNDHEQLKAVYGKNARDWASSSLYERAAAYDEAKGGRRLRVLVRSLYTATCSDVHGDAMSAQWHLQPKIGSNLVVQRRPTPEDLGRALFFANDIAFLIAWQLGEFCGSQKEEEAVAIFRLWTGQ